MTDENKVPRRKPFYGWAITAMGTLGNALQGGIIFWSMGLYTSTFEDHFGASRARVTLIETFLSVGVNVMSPFVGLFVDTRSARHVVAVGALAMGSGLIVVSMAGTLLTVWAAFALFIPLGVLAVGVLPSSTLISRWFRKRRGLALGISVTGTSLGGAIAPPLLTWVFLVYGWRDALMVTGLFVICLAPVFYRVLANYPEDRGLEQEEEGSASSFRLTEVDSHDWRVRDMFRTPAFWLQTVITGSMLAVTLGLLANLSLHAKDLGFDGSATALLYSTIAFCSFCGKVAVGALIDRIGVRVTGILTAIGMTLGLAGLAVVETYTLVLGSCVAIGLAMGGVMPVWTNLIARGFGAKSFGRAMGVMNPLHIPITAPSAPFAGYISDTTGSYMLVFLIYGGLMLLAAAGLVILRQPVAVSMTSNHSPSGP